MSLFINQPSRLGLDASFVHHLRPCVNAEAGYAAESQAERTWRMAGYVEMAVEWGWRHRDLDGVKSIGIDEIAWKEGQEYLTLVYQIDEHSKQLLWIRKERKAKILLNFFHCLGSKRSGRPQHISSDMWKARWTQIDLMPPLTG